MTDPDAPRPGSVLHELFAILGTGALPGGSLEDLLDRIETPLWEDR